MKQVVAIAVSVLVGLGAGWLLHRPSVCGNVAAATPSSAGVDRPSDAEATDAVRRSRKVLGPSTVTIKVGDCASSGNRPSLRCTVQLFDGPGAAAIPHIYVFARLAGRWEVAG